LDSGRLLGSGAGESRPHPDKDKAEANLSWSLVWMWMDLLESRLTGERTGKDNNQGFEIDLRITLTSTVPEALSPFRFEMKQVY
jgi:hypothetical protein